jgi:DNA ligase-associated metallophosphoesterase
LAMRCSLSAASPLTLLPHHAAITPEGTLVVADLHLGKAPVLREKGLPIPKSHTRRNLNRLFELVVQNKIRRLVIAGDFLHGTTSRTPTVHDAVRDFLGALSIPVTLVLGNHDRKNLPLPDDWPMEIVESLELEGWHVVHDPADAPPHRPSISAHWHPVFRVQDGKRSSLRLPCFWLKGQRLILPSFGSFTGGQRIQPGENDRVFAPLDGQVYELPASMWSVNRS